MNIIYREKSNYLRHFISCKCTIFENTRKIIENFKQQYHLTYFVINNISLNNNEMVYSKLFL